MKFSSFGPKHVFKNMLGQFLDGGARFKSLKEVFASINFRLFHLCSGKKSEK